jgi:hypothetical protein
MRIGPTRIDPSRGNYPQRLEYFIARVNPTLLAAGEDFDDRHAVGNRQFMMNPGRLHLAQTRQC